MLNPLKVGRDPHQKRDAHAGERTVSDDLLLVAGEALVDLIPLKLPDGTDPRLLDLVKTSADAVLGGSPFNTAIGLGRLGVPCAFAGRVSTDTFGDAMVERLRASHVVLDFLLRDDRPSPLAFVTRGTEQTGARYAFYLGSTAYDGPAPFAEAWPGRVVHLHIGSFSATEGGFGEAAFEALRRAAKHATVSYDPNIRPLVVGPPAATAPLVEARVRLATVVKASDEDLVWLYPNADPHAAAAHWSTLGPRLVVLTRGGAGALGFFGGRHVECPAPRITVADTVGAGDSFMAALMATMVEDGALGRRALHGADPYTERQVRGWLSFAGAAAAITCTRKGANPPTRDEMREAMAETVATATS